MSRATDSCDPGSPSPSLDLPADALKVGVRILDHLHLEELLDEREGWRLFLADNQALPDLVLLAVAESAEALEACLEGPGHGRVVRKTIFASWHIAEVELDEAHLWLFHDKLLPMPRRLTGATMPSTPGLVEQQLEEGTLFNDRYDIESLLGHGGMGEVYRAQDKTFQRSVAIKVVRVDTTAAEGDREQAKRRLLNESRMVAALKHPNIVEIYDAGECDGLPYLALELCGDGSNLRSAMKTEAPREERLLWLSQIAEALAYAHEHGIMHRDVKPENVLLTSDKKVKVADFGIAKAVRSERAHDNTTIGIVGTPLYMAPEQLFGQRSDARVDQYAWGIVAYELLTGVHPRTRELANLHGGDPMSTAARLPPHLRRVLARATANDPAQRYPNFRKLLADLHQPPHMLQRRWLAVGFAVLAGAGALFHFANGTNAGAPPSAPTSSAFVPPRATAPKSEADGLIEQGIQLWADASIGPARGLFRRAVKLEPSNARGHLLLFAASEGIQAVEYDAARIAFTLRSQLTPPELSLLEALHPLVEEPPDEAASTQRIEELARTYPDNLIVRLARAQHYVRARETRRAIDLAATLGPTTTAFWLGAQAQLQLGNATKGRELLEQCIASSPSAMDCLQWMTMLDENDGRCEVAEATIRKRIAQDPNGLRQYILLANAVFARTKSTDAARGILQALIERAPPDQQQAMQAAFNLNMHLYEGDFAGVSHDIGEWQSATAAASDAVDRGTPLIHRVLVDLELGRTSEARRAAQDFAHRSQAWLPYAYLDTNIEAARLLYFSSQISRSEFHLARDRAIAKQIQRGAYFSSPGLRWFDDYVQCALDATDAEEAIAAMPADNVIDLLERHAGVDVQLGHMYLLAGHLDEAVSWLQRAASSCTSIADPLHHVQGLFWLGEALDRKGDHAGACKMYTKVVERWGREPRSLTARQARAKLSTCH